MTKNEKIQMKKLQNLRYKIACLAEELEASASLAEENSKTARTAERFGALRDFASDILSESSNNMLGEYEVTL